MKWETLFSPLLKGVAGLCHGFTLRAAGDFSKPELAEKNLLAQTGATRLRLLHQVHETALVTPQADDDLPKADGWVGYPTPGAILGVRTADCLPVMMVHPPTGALALLHAGWRGATAGICSRGVATLTASHGVSPDELLVALGPSIGPCCYEVGDEVARAADNDPRWLKAKPNGKFQFDLAGYVRAELQGCGVATERIDSVGGCTACEADRFFSHRARREPGRMLAYLGFTEAVT